VKAIAIGVEDQMAFNQVREPPQAPLFDFPAADSALLGSPSCAISFAERVAIRRHRRKV